MLSPEKKINCQYLFVHLNILYNKIRKINIKLWIFLHFQVLIVLKCYFWVWELLFQSQIFSMMFPKQICGFPFPSKTVEPFCERGHSDGRILPCLSTSGYILDICTCHPKTIFNSYHLWSTRKPNKLSFNGQKSRKYILILLIWWSGYF